MLNGDGNDNSKKSVGLKLAKKNQLYTCSTLLQLHVILPFFVFVFFLHDYNVKLPSYTSYVRNVVCAHQSFVASVSVRFFHCCLLLWIKGYLDDNNEGKWKSFVNHYLEKHGCKLVFSANLKCQETHLLNISDPFVSRNCRILEYLKLYYYSFKIFPQF